MEIDRGFEELFVAMLAILARLRLSLPERPVDAKNVVHTIVAWAVGFEVTDGNRSVAVR